MPGIKELKTRIKSIGGTRKVTRAMQMVSAAKMRKAQSATLASRTYSTLAWELITNLTEGLSAKSALLNTHPKAKKIGILVISSNRGMVGSMNVNLINKLKELDGQPDIICELAVYGKKAKDMLVRLNKHLVADFPKLEKAPSVEDIYPIAEFLTKIYEGGNYKEIVILYNHFVSTLTQKPMIKRLLPFGDGKTSESVITDVETNPSSEVEVKEIDSPYLFEPTPAEVLNHLLPRIIESQIYQAILESDASEHSARMVMMKNATDAAGDLIADYTLTFNQLRQNKITTELSEITAGRIALE